MTVSQTPEQQARTLLSWAKDVLEGAQDYYPLGDCECDECRECGKLPAECSKTECAASCSCSDCDGCRIKAVIKAIEDFGTQIV
jgi:hypothetical protein